MLQIFESTITNLQTISGIFYYFLVSKKSSVEKLSSRKNDQNNGLIFFILTSQPHSTCMCCGSNSFVGGHSQHPEAEKTAGQIGAGL